MNDLIKVVQKCIDRIYNHLLVYVETEFHRKFGLFSPSVTGIDEAISRVKNSKPGEWGSSLEFEGDFEDLYSNCNSSLLEECTVRASSLSDLDVRSVEFILTLMKCIMIHISMNQMVPTKP